MTFQSKFPFPKINLIILFVLCSASSASAQQCSLKIEQLTDAPELRGFRLGMTYDQVKARVPQIQFGRADEIGVTKTSINPFYDSRFDQASFADVRTISLDFLDGQLTTLWIGYESSFKWQTVNEFVRGISKSLNVPAAWSPKKGGQELRCDGFTVLVSLIAGNPSVRLTDDVADQTIAARREEAAEAAESMVIGDKSTKLYYPSDCDAVENVTPPNRITFKDKDEAEKAGYKLAKECSVQNRSR
jgi:hypothetical protein